MNKFPVTTPVRAKLRCNACLQTVPPRDGDWFVSVSAGGQQIFLCKPCEPKQRLTHKRASSKDFPLQLS